MAFEAIGIDVQQDSALDPAVLAPRLRAAERLGFDGVWVTGGIRPGSPSPLETLAFAAGVTERVRLGLGVLVGALFAPLHLARSVATVDQLCRGRLVLGVGLGHGGDSYLRHGIATPAHRGRHFENRMVTLRSLLTRETTTAVDPTLHNEPRPLPPARPEGPPLWFGGRSAGALDRAARLGDGWLGAGSMPLEVFYGALDAVRARLAGHGRDAGAFVIGKRVLVHVGNGDAATAAALGAWFERYHGDASAADRLLVSGTAEQVAAALAGLRERGVRELVLSPIFDEDEQLHRLANDVCPHVPPPVPAAPAATVS